MAPVLNSFLLYFVFIFKNTKCSDLFAAWCIYMYIYTPTCIKIRTFCVLEDKYKVQLKLFQNRCQLLLDVRGGSYEHANRFTKPVSILYSVEHSYITYLVQGGQTPPVRFCLGIFWELAFTYLYWLFLSFKMQKTKS